MSPGAGVLPLFLLASLASAQATYFPFAIDQDRLAGAPDFSFLNRPLDAGDRLFVRDGHFHRAGADLQPGSADDERVRLFGVNLAFGANFPTAADSVRIAKRLRRLGVNLVRFHHMDTQPDSNPANAGSILTTGPYPTFNPVALSLLRQFLDALKAEGIYANINLHVGYTFRPVVDDVPALPDNRAFPSQSKPLHVLHPRLVELQRRFAASLLEGLSLRDDPVLGMVEINNESSLGWSWQANQLDSNLLGVYRDTAQALWNDHLRERYRSSAELREAWGATEAYGPELLPGAWRPLELHGGAQASLETLANTEPPTVKVQVTKPGGWVILKQTGFSLERGAAYSAEFEIRADLPAGATRSLYTDVKEDISPWRVITSRSVSVSNQWQKVRHVFLPSFEVNAAGRLHINCETAGAPVYVRAASVRAGGRRGLSEAESLEDGTVEVVAAGELGTDARTNDYLRFLAARDKDYLDSMLAAVREAVGELVPVAGTQMGFSGLMYADSHVGLDYVDEHFYVDHYSFPNVSWDGRDWRFADTSSVGSGLATILKVAAARIHGKPYTVSEYNQPWPNTYAAEINPLLAALGAFQDWDSIMYFAYAHGRNWDAGVPGGFNLDNDPGKWPSTGQAAWLFRSGALQAGREPVDIPIPEATRLRYTRERRTSGFNTFFQTALGYDPLTAVAHPVRLRPDLEEPLGAEGTRKREGRVESDSGEIAYDPGAKVFLLQAPQVAGVIGFLGKQRATAGPLDVELAPASRGFAAILLSALDGKPLVESERLLLTNPGYTLRTQPGSNPARPQQIVAYQQQSNWWTLEPDQANKPSGNLNGGNPPIWMERVEATVTFRTAAASLTVYPLDGTGSRLEPLPPGQVEKTESGYRLRLQAEGQPLSPWYELVARW